ncbi:hypothetical protein, partial [Enterococcus faecium]
LDPPHDSLGGQMKLVRCCTYMDDYQDMMAAHGTLVVRGADDERVRHYAHVNNDALSFSASGASVTFPLCFCPGCGTKTEVVSEEE